MLRHVGWIVTLAALGSTTVADRADAPEDDVNVARAEIEEAMRKWAEPLKGICAVPPFVNRDLSRSCTT